MVRMILAEYGAALAFQIIFTLITLLIAIVEVIRRRKQERPKTGASVKERGNRFSPVFHFHLAGPGVSPPFPPGQPPYQRGHYKSSFMAEYCKKNIPILGTKETDNDVYSDILEGMENEEREVSENILYYRAYKRNSTYPYNNNFRSHAIIGKIKDEKAFMEEYSHRDAVLIVTRYDHLMRFIEASEWYPN